jgi:hypothetical protein
MEKKAAKTAPTKRGSKAASPPAVAQEKKPRSRTPKTE